MPPSPQYVPKELYGNVNVSHRSPIKELFTLLVGILGIVLAVYIVLGFAVDYVTPKIPAEVERKLGALFTKAFNNKDKPYKSERLQQMLDGLVKELPENTRQYNLILVPEKQMNAVALPGGNIIVFSGLLKEVESDNELAFVLAHELGHFANRDHLRGLGRGLVLLAISAAMLGSDSVATNFIMNTLINVNMKFSQQQEQKADLWALDLLNKRFGSVKGAKDFIQRINKKEKTNRFFYYFATHPHPQDRLKTLEDHILKKGYQVLPGTTG